MSPQTRAAALAAAVLSACQAAPLEPPREVRPVPPAVLERLRVADAPEPTSLEPLHLLGSSSEADREGLDAPRASIELADVLSSVEEHFPLILAALEEVEIASAGVQQAEGGFDVQLSGRGGIETGNYDSERLDLSLEQPLAPWGMSVFGGYRLGTGDFAVYDGKAKTNDAGEARVGLSVPLLRGREIDRRRVAVWRARLERAQADPTILAKRLEATLKAAEAYWRWVGWGRRREIALRLLALAEDRMGQIERAVEEGLLARINLTENQRLIVERRSNLLGAERGLQQAAILLSLYWRDAAGQPAVPGDELLPYEFPVPKDPAEVTVADDVALALERRPELLALELQLADLRLQGELAENDVLPAFDLGLLASQDLGDAANVPDDKDDLEVEARLSLKVPLQRRTARGKVRELTAKTVKLQRETQFARDRVVSEVQDATSALTQSWLRIEQARENVRLANELAEAERSQLREGESDLLRVNLREQQSALAAAVLVDVLEKYFRELAKYRAVLGIGYGADPGAARTPAP